MSSRCNCVSASSKSVFFCLQSRRTPLRGARHTREALGKELFRRLFGLVLGDNGTEVLERSVFHGRALTKVHCDTRQSQQKGGCERQCA